ncbi:IS110 family transposase [Rhizobium sp. LjRoot254]|uniref:IS110 family transposase n=1 Tax=Rhizobium sp. LjRoot254 TaxID=3342297 RepID=UPI003ECD67BC
MISELSFVGIDVSKARLDVHIHPAGHVLVLANISEHFSDLIARLRVLGASVVGLEASGGYERPLADALHAAGIDVRILQPSRVRGFARSIGQLAKTDAIDAAVIARYLATAHQALAPYRRDPALGSLGALLGHRRRLVAERSGLLSQCDTETEPLVLSLIEERLAAIERAIVRIKDAVHALVADNPAVSGVGPVLATTLLADLPELGQVSGKTVAALLGVAPHARQSGKANRPGRCSGGRKHLRDIAYMAVLSAIKAGDPILGGFYKRLRQNGKPFKLAMVATIRKLITILNAIARTDPAFAT